MQCGCNGTGWIRTVQVESEKGHFYDPYSVWPVNQKTGLKSRPLHFRCPQHPYQGKQLWPRLNKDGKVFFA